jgi:hypothetical protein
LFLAVLMVLSLGEEAGTMWASLVLLAATASVPNQTGDLQISNVRVTTGPFGTVRANEMPELLPGDIFYVNYDVENLVMDDNGGVKYTMTFELANSKGSVIYKDGPKDGVATLSLGGGRMPAFAHSEIGKETEAGEYSLKITITDRGAKDKDKATKEITKKFKVKKLEFGIVRPVLTYVGQREVFLAPPVCVVGQTLVANCVIASPARSKEKDKQPDVEITVNIIDDATKKPTTAKPAVQVFNKDIDEKQDYIDISYPVDLNRAGKFTIELIAKDRISGKSETVKFPVTVQEIK